MEFAVIGGGVTGRLAAALLKQQRPDADIAVFEKQTGAPPSQKTIALNAASVAILREAAPDLPALCAPITAARIHAAGFEGGAVWRAKQWQLPAFAWSISLEALIAALPPVKIINAAVADFRQDNNAVSFTANGAARRARFAVLTAPPDIAPFKTRVFSYGQTAWTGAGMAEKLEESCAYEIFSPQGMLAVVPQSPRDVKKNNGEKQVNNAGAILCAPQSAADKLSKEQEWRETLNAASGGALHFVHADAPRAYPLSLRVTSPYAHGRIFLAGNGASSLHPAGAQGLNLGVRDAACLAGIFADIRDPDRRAAYYHRARRADRRAAIAASSALAAGATLRAPPMRAAAWGLARAAEFMPARLARAFFQPAF